MDTQMVLTHTGKIYFNRSLGLEFLTVGDYGKENNIKADFLGLTQTSHPVLASKSALSPSKSRNFATSAGKSAKNSTMRA